MWTGGGHLPVATGQSTTIFDFHLFHHSTLILLLCYTYPNNPSLPRGNKHRFSSLGVYPGFHEIPLGHSTSGHRIETYRLIPRADGTILPFVTIFFCFVIPIPNATKTKKEGKKKSPQNDCCMSYGASSRVYFAACICN